MSDDSDWLAAELEALRTPPRHGWPPADEIRRRGALRHRRRRIGLASGLSAIALAALLVAFVAVPVRSGPPLPVARRLAGPDGSAHLVVSTTQATTAGPRTVSELATSEQAFALALTRQELSGTPQSNVVLSPMSADIDLSMLELGAAGSTEEEIATALHSSGLSAGENAAAWRALVSSELTGEPPGELSLANSLWVQRHLHVETGFLRSDAADFGNDTYQVNFGAPTATKAINAWVAKQTAGRITTLFTTGELSATTVVVLANALHFHAAWAKAHQFTVMNQPFVTANGTTVSVPTLNGYRDQLAYATTPSYQAVQIPFSTGRFAALVVAPKHGTLSGWLAGLTPDRLAAVVGSLSMGTVYLTMPELSLSSRPLLNAALSAMGMAGAFRSADLAPMLGSTVGTNVYVTKVQQADTLEVTTGGVDAAASTGTGVTFDSVGPTAPIGFDHPYLFLLRDIKTGMILFSSVVNDPAGP